MWNLKTKAKPLWGGEEGTKRRGEGNQKVQISSYKVSRSCGCSAVLINSMVSIVIILQYTCESS